MLKRRSENALNQYIVGVRLIYKSSWSMIARRMKAGKNVYRFKMNMSMSIDQANTRLSAARNAGIDWVFAHSDSDWLSFMDSDGWVYPQMLERLYHAVLEHNVKVSIYGYEETGAEKGQ